MVGWMMLEFIVVMAVERCTKVLYILFTGDSNDISNLRKE